jgi:hypothetical protein
MKTLYIAMTAAALLAASLSAQSREPRPIVITCSPGHRPMLWHVVFAVEMSDYIVSPKVRREILARARETCAASPSAVLTFAPASYRHAERGPTEMAAN